MIDVLQRIEAKLDRILRRLDQVLEQDEVILMIVDDLEAKVAAQTTVVASVETLLAEVTAKLKDAITHNEGFTAADSARLQAIASTLDSNTTRLSAAVVKGTAAESETPPVNTTPTTQPASASAAVDPGAASPAVSAPSGSSTSGPGSSN